MKHTIIILNLTLAINTFGQKDSALHFSVSKSIFKENSVILLKDNLYNIFIHADTLQHFVQLHPSYKELYKKVQVKPGKDLSTETTNIENSWDYNLMLADLIKAGKCSIIDLKSGQNVKAIHSVEYSGFDLGGRDFIIEGHSLFKTIDWIY